MVTHTAQGELMPTRPARACRCGAVVRGACAACSKQRDRARGSAAKRGYGVAHEGWRSVILCIDPICRGCLAAASTHAEHVESWQDGGEKDSIENGQGCCASCANYKSQREQHDPSFGRRLKAAGALLADEAYTDPMTGRMAYRKPPAPKWWRHLREFA